MGRIKSTMVKKAAKQMLEKERDSFNKDFEHNKKLLTSMLPSKSIRNKVAGYISRLIIMQDEEKRKRAATPITAQVANSSSDSS